jgi:dipeptidase D
MSENGEICNLEPKDVWGNFAKLTQIPRPSTHEEKISQFLKEFGEKLGLETKTDKVGNVIIAKPAAAGMEDHKAIILQAHMDMVPQKDREIKHDFVKDPIEAYVDGEWVTAKGTTLGADNGLGVAMIMTILASKDIKHGPLQALFTVDEEAGMTGVTALDGGLLKGDILINLDCEDDEEFDIGCAGGGYTSVYQDFNNEAVPDNSSAYKINVTGLTGGHSGVDIILGRGNANKIMNRLCWYAGRNFALRVAEIDGGSLPNAIPFESTATVVVSQDKEQEFLDYGEKIAQTIKAELQAVDPDVKITIAKTDMPPAVMDKKIQDKLLNAIYACPCGVLGMSADIPNLVETSTNLARVMVKDKKIEMKNLSRSSVESRKEDVANMLRSVFELMGAKIDYHNAYPGWQPNMKSPILKIMKDSYVEKYGKEPKMGAVHAGLECGMLLAKCPKLDAIAIGPLIKFPHSPGEKINIKSVAKFWEFLLEVLGKI